MYTLCGNFRLLWLNIKYQWYNKLAIRQHEHPFLYALEAVTSNYHPIYLQTGYKETDHHYGSSTKMHLTVSAFTLTEIHWTLYMHTTYNIADNIQYYLGTLTAQSEGL